MWKHSNRQLFALEVWISEWSLDEQHQHHLETCQRCNSSTLDILNQKS